MGPKKKLKAPTLFEFITRNPTRDVSENEQKGGEISSDGQQTESTATSMVKPKFQQKWLKMYPWLEYDDERDIMHCTPCRAIGLQNTMAVGCRNFKTTTLTRHLECSDHKRAIIAPVERSNMRAAIDQAISKQERGIMQCMKVVYWLAKECVPLSKYASLMGLLVELGTPDLETLTVNDHVTYTSYKTACGLLESINSVIDQGVTQQLQASPVLTIMTDESTDIAVHHKLCISARITDPETLYPSTVFLTDLRIDTCTGEGIFNEIRDHLKHRNISVTKVTALGTDGATVMTGRKEGLMGQFLRQNPMVQNCHCSAHRIALCSEQAADGIPAMKYYQGIIESIFYYFKQSPTRNHELEVIQKQLSEPNIKYREVHQVRWLSFYEALQSVYRTIDSLISYFHSRGLKDPKATGLKKKIATDFFIQTTYGLMDLLQPIMTLSLFFQKEDVDIGTVQIAVDACLADLESLLSLETDADKPTFIKQLDEHLVDGVFKGNHVIQTSKYSYSTTRRAFVQAMIDNINKRFPARSLLSSFCVLGMRPLSFLTGEQLNNWGNDSIDILLEHFAKEQTHTYKGNVSTAPPLVQADETKREWSQVKLVVKEQQYPRTSTRDLWSLIAQYHRGDFPNLMVLVQLALSHPVHTSDCERAFSKQNAVVTPLRNRISSDHVEWLMRVMIQGQSLQNFDFQKALSVWRQIKRRIIFN